MKGKESKIKQQAWNRARTERLGTDPKRSQESAESGTRAQLLHLIRRKEGDAYVASCGSMIHDSWNGLRAIYVCWSRIAVMPSTADFDTVCKLCSKSAGFTEGEQDSSATNTSSSSEAGE